MKERLFPTKPKEDTIVPKHIAIIMDGNGRWAKRRGLPRTAGHKKGADTVRRVIEACGEHRIGHLTLYAFSSENWQRSEQEVRDLMSLLRFYLEKELPYLHKNDIRVQVIGERGKLSDDIRKKIEDAEQLTENNRALTLSIALSYGSHQEIARAMRLIGEEIASGALTPSDINEELIASYLYTANLPAPDLLIRTGGEQRLSNFLLWQTAYTELYFTDTLWPDFSKEDFIAALSEYATRERRYGTA
jgi:undecaprenyl diphosphate synthase